MRIQYLCFFGGGEVWAQGLIHFRRPRQVGRLGLLPRLQDQIYLPGRPGFPVEPASHVWFARQVDLGSGLNLEAQIHLASRPELWFLFWASAPGLLVVLGQLSILPLQQLLGDHIPMAPPWFSSPDVKDTNVIWANLMIKTPIYHQESMAARHGGILYGCHDNDRWIKPLIVFPDRIPH